MAYVQRQIEDKRGITLIRRYLEAGTLSGGLVIRLQEGTPQGGSLSPLLSDILLNELDRELERRGHRFVHYADDANIYVCSPGAGMRVMTNVERFLSQRLKLMVSWDKMIKHIRKVYACHGCETAPVNADKPAQLIEKNMVSPSVLAMLLTTKYVDGLPLHRFEKVLGRHGVDIPRQTLARCSSGAANTCNWCSI